MFTILNLLNYLSGKPLSSFVLITVTIIIYFILIKYYSETIYDNTILSITLLIILILDIVSIILIYFYDRPIDNDELQHNIIGINSNNNIEVVNKTINEEKKSRKDKSKSKKNKSNELNDNKKVISGENKEKSYPMDIANKDIISLFDINKDPSLITY
jgi:hypothetical protein